MALHHVTTIVKNFDGHKNVAFSLLCTELRNKDRAHTRT